MNGEKFPKHHQDRSQQPNCVGAHLNRVAICAEITLDTTRGKLSVVIAWQIYINAQGHDARFPDLLESLLRICAALFSFSFK
ncbi:hypothetical protein N9B79_00580 [bacterium]|nr:hypothetical protein [bacterium]